MSCCASADADAAASMAGGPADASALAVVREFFRDDYRTADGSVEWTQIREVLGVAYGRLLVFRVDALGRVCEPHRWLLTLAGREGERTTFNCPQTEAVELFRLLTSTPLPLIGAFDAYAKSLVYPHPTREIKLVSVEYDHHRGVLEDVRAWIFSAPPEPTTYEFLFRLFHRTGRDPADPTEQTATRATRGAWTRWIPSDRVLYLGPEFPHFEMYKWYSPTKDVFSFEHWRHASDDFVWLPREPHTSDDDDDDEDFDWSPPVSRRITSWLR